MAMNVCEFFNESERIYGCGFSYKYLCSDFCLLNQLQVDECNVHYFCKFIITYYWPEYKVINKNNYCIKNSYDKTPFFFYTGKILYSAKIIRY